MASEADKILAQQVLTGITPAVEMPSSDPAASLVPDILNTPPEQITAGQPPMSAWGQFKADIRAADALQAERKAQGLQPDYPIIADLVAPLATSVAQNETLQPGIRGVAADALTSARAAQAAQDVPIPVDQTAQAELQAKLAAAGLAEAPPIAAPAALPVPEIAVEAKDLVPDQKIMAEAKAKIVRPAQEAIAEQDAFQQADAQLAQAALSARQREDQLKNDITKLDDDVRAQVRNRSLPEMLTQGSYTSRIMSGLAVLAGGVSSGILGKEGNVVIDQIDKGVEQQAAKDKLNNEQRMALKREALDAVKTQIDTLQARTQNASAKANLDIAKAKLHQEREELNLKIMQAHQAKALNNVIAGLRSEGSVPAATPQIAKRNSQLNAALQAVEASDPKRAEGLREVLVTTPDGSIQIANVNKERVQEFQKYASETAPAVELLRKVQKFAAQASKLSLEDRGAMGSMLKIAAGKLRLPITGPGAMTEDEFNRLQETIGDPLKIIAIPSVELAKLDSVMSVLNADLASRAGEIGVKWPATKAEQVAAALRNRGYSPSEIRAALEKRR